MSDAATELAALAAAVAWPDAAADAVAAAATAGQQTAGTGRLVEFAGWLAETQGRAPADAPRRARLLVLSSGERTPDAVFTLAERAGCGVAHVEFEAGTPEAAALTRGVDAVDSAVDSGVELISLAAGPASVGHAALVSLLAGVEPVALLPRGVHALDAAAWTRRAVEVRDTRRRVADRRGDPAALLAALADPTLAAAVGVLLRSAGRRTPVLVDGGAAAAAALLAWEVQSQAARWWRFADESADPVQARVGTQLGPAPVLALGTATGDGSAAMLALPLVIAAAEISAAETVASDD